MTIVEEIRKDRESGAKRLEAEYKAGLMTLARRFCTDPSDAEELVNATFAAVVDNIDNYLEQSAFFGWMCQILTNIYTMDSRRTSFLECVDEVQTESTRVKRGTLCSGSQRVIAESLSGS